MVSKQEDMVEQVEAPEADDSSDIVREIAELDRAEGVETGDQTAEGQPTPAEPAAAEALPASPEAKKPEEQPVAQSLPQQDSATAILQQRLAQMESRLAQEDLEKEVKQYAVTLQERGVDPVHVDFLADQFRKQRVEQQQIQRQAQTTGLYYQGKMNAALFYAEKYGVPPRSLMDYDTPQGMESAAKQAKKVADLEAQVAKLQQGKVPPQHMEGGRPAAQGRQSDAALVDSAANKPYNMRTPAEQAAIKRAAGY